MLSFATAVRIHIILHRPRGYANGTPAASGARSAIGPSVDRKNEELGERVSESSPSLHVVLALVETGPALEFRGWPG